MKLKKYIPIVIMLCLVAGAAALMLAGDGVTVEMLTNYAPKNTALAVVVALLAYAVKSQTVFVLYGVVATAVGIVFEPPLSLIVNAVGSVICISVPYFTGRASGGEAAHKLLKKYKKTWRGLRGKQGQSLPRLAGAARYEPLERHSRPFLRRAEDGLLAVSGEQLHRDIADDGALHPARQRPGPDQWTGSDMSGHRLGVHRGVLDRAEVQEKQKGEAK